MSGARSLFLSSFRFFLDDEKTYPADQTRPLILVESDFWYNLVRYNKKVVLVNGKISETSQIEILVFSLFYEGLFLIRSFLPPKPEICHRFEI